MPFTATITEQINESGNVIANNNSYSAGARNGINEPVLDGATDMLVNTTVDISQAKLIWLSCDQDLTVKTDDAATPTDTINLLAGRPLLWHPNSYASNPFSADVTALYVTNASGSAATFEMVLLHDPTP